MIAQKYEQKEWVDEATAEVTAYLSDDRYLWRIAEYIRAIGGTASTSALELEALAFVAASVKARQYGTDIKETGIDIKSAIGYHVTRYTRYEIKVRKNSIIETKMHYNIYMRFLGGIEAPQIEFLFLSYDGEIEHADLSVRVVPAGRPPADTLWAVRKVVWAAAEPAE